MNDADFITLVINFNFTAGHFPVTKLQLGTQKKRNLKLPEFSIKTALSVRNTVLQRTVPSFWWTDIRSDKHYAVSGLQHYFRYFYLWPGTYVLTMP